MRRAVVLAFLALTSVPIDSATANVAPTARESAAALAVNDPIHQGIVEGPAAEVGDAEADLLMGLSHTNSRRQDDTLVLPGEFSGDVTVTPHSIFRGFTNSDDNPAAQGSLSYSVDVGLPDARPYVRFWGSNFDDHGEASVELDLGFGLSGTLADLGWDIGGLHRVFGEAGSAVNYAYWEIPLQISYAVGEHFSVLGQYSFSPNFIGDSGRGHYLLIGGRWQQPIQAMTLSLEGTTGHQWIADNAAFGTADYQDWRIAVSLTFNIN